jgi:hypothetical protein
MGLRYNSQQGGQKEETCVFKDLGHHGVWYLFHACSLELQCSNYLLIRRLLT